MWSNHGSEDGVTVELVLSGVGHKWRTNRSGTVEVRRDEHKWRAGSRDSSIGIANCYGLDGPVIESWWGWGGEIFITCPDRL
jgi:hypothetical protein